jgi:hypothetical protein
MKTLLIGLTIWALPLVGLADEVIDAGTLGFDELFRHATRNGTSDLRRQNQQSANDELMARGAETLKYYLDHVHSQNIMYFVKIHELLAYPGSEKLNKESLVAVFKESLNSPHKETRRAALFYLARFDAPEGFQRWLVPHLDQEEDINLAMRLLGGWGAVDVAPRITRFLKSDDERRRVSAVIALGELGVKDTAPDIVEMLHDPYFTVRYAAVRSLVQLDARKAVRRALKEAVKNDDVIYLRHLIQAAGALQDRWSVSTLKTLCDHQDEGLRLDVERALYEIKHGASREDDQESLAEFLGLPVDTP